MDTTFGEHYKYMGLYNPLSEQLKYDPKTSEIIEIYEKPYNKADESAARNGIYYDMDKNNDFDREMVKSLDQIPNLTKWGQTARFPIGTKQKLGLGVSKNGRKPSSWQQKSGDEVQKPIRRNFTRWHVIVDHIDGTWCAHLVEMQRFSKWNKGYQYPLMDFLANNFRPESLSVFFEKNARGSGGG